MPTITVNDGATIAFDDIDDVDDTEGDPLLFIHGIYVSRAQWGFQLEGLRERRRLIACDLRGHGESSASDGPYSVKLLTDDIVALLDQLGIERVVCCGHSFGGFVAQELAISYPERTSGVILAETLYGITSTPFEAAVANLSMTLLSGGDPSAIARTLAGYFGSVSPEIGRLILREAQRHVEDPENLKKIMQASLAFDSRSRLGQIRCPTLILTAQIPHIPLVSVHAIEMFWRIPQARWSTITGAGHMLHWDNVREFNKTVGLFLDLMMRGRFAEAA